MLTKTAFFLLPALALAAAPQNDWSKPCTSGSCSYVSGDGKNTAWSTLEINAASTSSLSDITTAAGWEILDCDENSTEAQDIRLVCVDRSAGCKQLFDGGAENTIVRLPENCAGGPFARVQRVWIHEDQSLPARLAKRQTGNRTKVRGLALDFDFSKIPESNGQVFMTVSATNSERQRDALGTAAAKRSLMPLRHANKRAQAGLVVRDFAAASHAKKAVKKRQFFGGIGDFFSDAADSVGGFFGGAADTVVDAGNDFVDNVSSGFDNVVEAGNDFVDDVSSGFDNVVEAGNDFVDDVSSGFDSVVDNVQTGFDDAVDFVGGAVEDVQSGFNDVVEDVSDGVNNVVEDVSNGFNDVVDGVSGAVDDAVEFVGDAADNVGEVVNDAVDGAGEAIGQIVDTATGQVEKFVDAVDGLTDFNEEFSTDVELLNVNQNFPIFSTSINCPGEGNAPDFEAGIDINADVNAQLTATVGFIVTGSIVPPNIDQLAVTGTLNGGVEATFNVKANAKGTFSTGDIQLFQVGLPGLSFPGIITVGPSFSINAEASAELGITADLSVTAGYDLPTIELVFPPDQGESVAEATPKESPLKVAVGASAELTGSAKAALKPALELGIDVLNGLAEATVFLNVEGAATLNFNLQAEANATPISGDVDDINFNGDIESSFGGSVGMELSVSVNAGANANLLQFFDVGDEIELFSQTFPIFEQNFGNQANKKVKRSSLSRRQAEGLVCPLASEAVANNAVVDTT